MCAKSVVQQMADNNAISSLPEASSHGGTVATIVSLCAFVFSGFSLYESTLKQPQLETFVPPVIHYGRDGGGSTEVFAVPITITNEGARTATVLSMELDVTDSAGTTKRYYSAYLGEHPRDSSVVNRAFAPATVVGREVFSETVRFYPMGNPLPALVSDSGAYKFKLTLRTARPSDPDLLDQYLRKEPQPVSFELTLPWFSEQQLNFRRATIAMHQKDWQPTMGGGAN